MDFPFSATSAFFSNILLLFTVILLKWVVTLYAEVNAFSFFRFYCAQFAQKVNKVSNSQTQQIIAGALALLINYATIIIILWLFEDFIEVLWLWHALLLFIALDSFHLAKQGTLIAKDLVANKKYEAKQKISSYLLRDTEQLSIMGISKSFIEMQLLRVSQHIVVVSFYFILFGPLAALSFRLLLEMHYCWNIKAARFQYFGKPIAFIVNLLQWLPTRISSILLLLLSLNSHSALFWQLVKKHFFQLNNNLLIHSFALVNEIRLGGVCIYQGEKLRRVSFNDQAKQPEPSNIIHASQYLKKYLICLAVITATIAGLSYIS
ncbi:MAG: cobalamin biosynthesis protein CobD/CbiB [Thalassotalea sp.]